MASNPLKRAPKWPPEPYHFCCSNVTNSKVFAIPVHSPPGVTGPRFCAPFWAPLGIFGYMYIYKKKTSRHENGTEKLRLMAARRFYGCRQELNIEKAEEKEHGREGHP